MKSKNTKLKIALLCGGPSLERGISLNSARSVCDHLHSEDIEIFPIDFDKVEIEVSVPRDFTLVATNQKDWDKKKKSSSIVYKFTGNQDFAGAVFLPVTDVKNFKAWQKICSSK